MFCKGLNYDSVFLQLKGSSLQAPGLTLPLEVVDRLLRAGIAKKCTVNFEGELITGAYPTLVPFS